MRWWDKNAAGLQQMVRESESKNSLDYADDEVRRAIVHAREDIVLIVSNLSSLNKQLRTVRLLLWVLTTAIIWMFLLTAGRH